MSIHQSMRPPVRLPIDAGAVLFLGQRRTATIARWMSRCNSRSARPMERLVHPGCSSSKCEINCRVCRSEVPDPDLDLPPGGAPAGRPKFAGTAMQIRALLVAQARFPKPPKVPAKEEFRNESGMPATHLGLWAVLPLARRGAPLSGCQPLAFNWAA
jgi:hypothetical protein